MLDHLHDHHPDHSLMPALRGVLEGIVTAFAMLAMWLSPRHDDADSEIEWEDGEDLDA